MVVVMEERASEDQIQHVIATLVEKEFDVHRSTGALKTVLGAVGGHRGFDRQHVATQASLRAVGKKQVAAGVSLWQRNTLSILQAA